MKAMDRDNKDQVMVNRRPHSVDLGGLDRNRHPWLLVIPGKRNRPKQLDELSYEFRRAGIGVCFEGRSNMHALYRYILSKVCAIIKEKITLIVAIKFYL